MIFLSPLEPINFSNAEMDGSWILALQEELNQLKGGKV